VAGVVTAPIRVAHIATVDSTVRFLLLGQLRRLRDEGFDVTAISAAGPWTSDVESDGIRHITWRSATRSWNPRKDVLAFFELLAILRAERFDLVHTHNPKPGILGRVAGRVAGVPSVLNTVHGLYAMPEDPARKRFVVLALERLAARLSNLELYQSEEDLAWARKTGVVPSSRSALLGNGTDLSFFDPAASTRPDGELRMELGIPAGNLVVGSVGRFVAEKGVREFLDAARRVRADRPDVSFLMVGDRDPDKPDSLPRDELARAGRDMIFTEWRTDVRDLLALMDVFVLASWREGVPRSAIEAAAMGKPLVLTDIRGCREVARSGVDGLLVPPRDAGKLAAAIMTLIADPDLRSRMGQAARSRAVEKFDEANVADRIVAHYRRVLAMNGSGSTRIGVPRKGAGATL
jgi:glycosyltransferase involved in cell wall biosynthesis